MHTYRLKGASGKVVGQSVGLGEKTRIGRAADCDLIVDEDGVAPHHAEIIREEEGRLQLRHVATGFETRVNGLPVLQAGLASGDEIRIGSCRWVLQAPGLRPQKILTSAAVKRRRSFVPWLLVTALIALVILAWQRGWIILP
jgi:pSer/pThr/pTyr-binding forkhead associated (FHA) protein